MMRLNVWRNTGTTFHTTIIVNITQLLLNCFVSVAGGFIDDGMVARPQGQPLPQRRWKSNVNQTDRTHNQPDQLLVHQCATTHSAQMGTVQVTFTSDILGRSRPSFTGQGHFVVKYLNWSCSVKQRHLCERVCDCEWMLCWVTSDVLTLSVAMTWPTSFHQGRGSCQPVKGKGNWIHNFTPIPHSCRSQTYQQLSTIAMES